VHLAAAVAVLVLSLRAVVEFLGLAMLAALDGVTLATRALVVAAVLAELE
jgi:hypothetical protein